jgi:hypothetical protein
MAPLTRFLALAAVLCVAAAASHRYFLDDVGKTSAEERLVLDRLATVRLVHRAPRTALRNPSFSSASPRSFFADGAPRAQALNNRMEAAFSIAANQAQDTVIAVRETLLRLIQMRLSMPDVAAAPNTWKQALAGLFALPGSAEDDDTNPLIDFHGPSYTVIAQEKKGILGRGRSGTTFGLCAPEKFPNNRVRPRRAPRQRRLLPA